MSQEQAPPHINYLARDFASFRQLLLDHLSVLAPGWDERSAADQGNALIDMLAYAADYMAYYQDAAATEMYLGTARLRRSVRRHAQLLDYHLHEGCNARVWVRVEVNGDVTLPKGAQLLTGAAGRRPPPVLMLGSADYSDALAQTPVVFETMHAATLFAAHNQIAFDSNEQYNLAVGATSARLAGEQLNLTAGDVLILAEIADPSTGRPQDASSARRHPVRITRIIRKSGIATIFWDEEDALPFRLALYRDFQAPFIRVPLPISVAWGNIVLADHGRTVADDELPPIPSGGRYRPRLRLAGMTYAVPYDHARARATQSATATLDQSCAEAMPAIELTELWRAPVQRAVDQAPPLLTLKQHPAGSGRYFPTKPWALRRDLLSSGSLAREYIVEMEDDGVAHLRFGFADGGWQPAVVGATLLATYRIGGGPLGNVGRDSIAAIALDPSTRESKEAIRSASNPLAAQGGASPERIEAARLNAPHAFRAWEPPDNADAEYDPRAFNAQSRCITPGDYASIAMRHPEVAEAVAEPRWTGSWTTVVVYVRRRHGWPEDAAFCAELRAFLEPYRLTGYDVVVAPPRYVTLNIMLVAYLYPNRLQSLTRAALLRALIGPSGFFHPDGVGFGQPVHRSRLIACAAAVEGVERVRVGLFDRAGAPLNDRPPEHIAIGPLEIARLPGAAGSSETSPNSRLLRIEGGII